MLVIAGEGGTANGVPIILYSMSRDSEKWSGCLRLSPAPSPGEILNLKIGGLAIRVKSNLTRYGVTDFVECH